MSVEMPEGSSFAEPLPVVSASPAAPAGEIEVRPLNLSRRPFVNTRPVSRAALALWLLGFALLALNVYLFSAYLDASREKRVAIAKQELEIEKTKREVNSLDQRIGQLDLEQQNREALYLNRKIGERTFSWSLLFDRLAEVLPDEVRLRGLTPRGVVEREAPRRLSVLMDDKSGPVTLTISGQAKNDEALLLFVDNLFAHRAFDSPDLSHESSDDKDGLVRFDLQVRYLPDAVLPAVKAAPKTVKPPALPSAAPTKIGALSPGFVPLRSASSSARLR